MEPLPVSSLGDRAHQDLRFIRSTMEGASSFTSVPGWGGMVMGVTALIAARVAWRQTTTDAWLGVWLVEAALAVAIGIVSIALKARAGGHSLKSVPARRFALGFTPAIVAGVLLTVALVHDGAPFHLPGVWLLLYGVAVVGGGTFSISIVRRLGVTMMILGALALVAPPLLGDLFMGFGFGLVQIGFGIVIARRHGG